MKKSLILTAVAIFLAQSTTTATASDKSKWEAQQTAGTLVNTLWECKEFLPPEPLAAAEKQVPDILEAGGFTEAEAAALAPKWISDVEKRMPGDPPMDAIQCQNVLALTSRVPEWMKQIKADQ